ncbi:MULTISPECIES: DUF1837 domain-containing protein [Methylomonas]|uniref:Anti-bacteriophage protein A/HamA C-terminal domain-containing protein n=2 Tax=Methylomonas TaxID=416 RepID=A0A126T1H1_9GAMM|nr:MULTISPECIES: DUF1837 domain-containing protein [Methylomonas]AMK75932.1 hypothetical protein JT25_005415 [Methylomonas denitrificans]OAI02050.1 hypothetical protein A1342_03705 [Methylomonas methanica]TCV84052.1 uncharacterized protein DUF1837 [Methylomonas methanica]
MALANNDIKILLSNTSALINHVYWFEQDISEPHASSHRGISINYVDIKEKRDEFIRELKSTILNWIYSKSKYNAIYTDELLKRNNDHQNTNAYLLQVVDQKFRKGHPQGQFGELLLFNFIQFFFSAPPLLRKMSITTNPALERNGADAIHYTKRDENDVFIIGESKCYESKYKFNSALEASVKSIVNSFEDLDNELILYLHDDFVDPVLNVKAKEFKDGKCEHARFELVCLIAYNETFDIDGDSETAIKKNIESCLQNRWSNTSKTLYNGIKQSIISRIHYIIFPVWELDKLLEEF